MRRRGGVGAGANRTKEQPRRPHIGDNEAMLLLAELTAIRETLACIMATIHRRSSKDDPVWTLARSG